MHSTVLLNVPPTAVTTPSFYLSIAFGTHPTLHVQTFNVQRNSIKTATSSRYHHHLITGVPHVLPSPRPTYSKYSRRKTWTPNKCRTLSSSHWSYHYNLCKDLFVFLPKITTLSRHGQHTPFPPSLLVVFAVAAVAAVLFPFVTSMIELFFDTARPVRTSYRSEYP